MNQAYIKNILTTTSSLLIIIITLNYFVDPGAVYFKSVDLKDDFAERYAKSLVESDNGLLWSSISVTDRNLAEKLSFHTKDIDCVVIGSSHVMEIGNYAKPTQLNDFCVSSLNLAVSGAGLADLLTLTYLAIHNGPPKKIILEVGPSTLSGKPPLNTTRLVSSSQYYSNYSLANLAILKSTINQDSRFYFTKYFNLLNLQYTKRSISLLLKLINNNNNESSSSIVHLMQKVDVNVGIDSAVKLPDSSLVYPNKYIKKQEDIPIPKDLFYYKNRMGREVSNIESINIFEEILIYIINSNVIPIIILTPYHENLLKYKDSDIVRSMIKNEEVLKNLAKKQRVPLMGSYDPLNLGCNSNEFYDFQHAKRECLNKIRVVSHKN